MHSVGLRARHGWQGVIIISGIQLDGDVDLFQIVQTRRSLGARLCTGQSRQQQRGENGDDGNDHQQFNERERAFPVHRL